ncbi:hypothetical protein [Ruegeria sp. HKCCA4812]|uniref:hypothetical protein n=1 Tax=Ruegeria sp. HKCCA4812 TaxID=2682993 RepID=UPI0014876C66|nr:hypothetical protein [Ruegeria sp. HKCCA4812]
MRTAHVVNFADPRCKNGAVACQCEIVRFVRGVRGPRKSPVTATQIKKWLRATPDEFVEAQIDAALSAGKITIRRKSLSSGRRYGGSYVYEVGD